MTSSQNSPEPNQTDDDSGRNPSSSAQDVDDSSTDSPMPKDRSSKLKSRFWKFLLNRATEAEVEKAVQDKAEAIFTKGTIKKFEDKEIKDAKEKLKKKADKLDEYIKKEYNNTSGKVNGIIGVGVVLTILLGVFTAFNGGPILDILSIDTLREKIEELREDIKELKQLENIMSIGVLEKTIEDLRIDIERLKETDSITSIAELSGNIKNLEKDIEDLKKIEGIMSIDVLEKTIGDLKVKIENLEQIEDSLSSIDTLAADIETLKQSIKRLEKLEEVVSSIDVLTTDVEDLKQDVRSLIKTN